MSRLGWTANQREKVGRRAYLDASHPKPFKAHQMLAGFKSKLRQETCEHGQLQVLQAIRLRIAKARGENSSTKQDIPIGLIVITSITPAAGTLGRQCPTAIPANARTGLSVVEMGIIPRLQVRLATQRSTKNKVLRPAALTVLWTGKRKVSSLSFDPVRV